MNSADLEVYTINSKYTTPTVLTAIIHVFTYPATVQIIFPFSFFPKKTLLEQQHKHPWVKTFGLTYILQSSK